MNPLATEVHQNTNKVDVMNKSVTCTDNCMKELKDCMKSLEATVWGDMDDQGQAGGRKRACTMVLLALQSPQSQALVRNILYSRCDVENMKESQLGISGKELEEQMADDHGPWQLDFLKPVDHQDNKFWVKKILDQCMESNEAKEKIKDGLIPEKDWTRAWVRRHVLKKIWSSALKEVKKIDNPTAQARAKEWKKKGNKATCNQRLTEHCREMVSADPLFRCTFRDEDTMHTIPSALIIEEVMTDVIAEWFDYEGIPAEVPIEHIRGFLMAGRAYWSLRGLRGTSPSPELLGALGSRKVA
ncbi:hypothetical protein FRC12_001395 [Ceratobasidium sp. 428]|nr:hypothetical protein FRC12_001395 [Ceratobasidium sp. 428]